MIRKSKFLKTRVTTEDVYELAIQRIEYAFDLFDKIAVLFSGGKDSTAALQLTLEVAHKRGEQLPLDVAFGDEEAIPYETERYVRRVSQRDDVNLRWLCLPFKLINGCSPKHPWWYSWDPELKDKWVRPLPPEGLTELEGFPIYPVEDRHALPECNKFLWPPEDGNVGVVMGIRAQESLTRRRAILTRAEEHFITKCDLISSRGNCWKIYPIYDWIHEDIWTAPNVFNWDYNDAYDVMEMAGLPVPMQRCSPAYGMEPLQKLWTYKTCFPDIWVNMHDRVPGANTAIRYATTELYGYGKLPEKPSDMNWEEFILRYIKRHCPDNKLILAERIRQEIKSHYKKTPDPILYEALHPETGISWKFLLMLAIRPDPKGRKQPGGKIDTKKIPQLWNKYNKALEAYRKEGADAGTRF